jgi:hypothetical protein
MAYAKYTREMLTEAVAASTSMRGVLRYLGLPMNGGAHAHLRRRIDQLGIDTSHFLGPAHFRGIPDRRRRSATEILILRPEAGSREKAVVLRRALAEIGRPYLCTECGTGDMWNGRPLVLHVDHIDGQMWDCRPENVRFLCPNCHSQTATYAGRKCSPSGADLILVDEQGNPVRQSRPREPMSEEQTLEVLSRVARNEILPSQAARLVGCSKGHVYRLLRRLAERGSIAATRRGPSMSDTAKDTIVTFALAHPSFGSRRIAAALKSRTTDAIDVSATTITKVLARANLRTREARAEAAQKAEARARV